MRPPSTEASPVPPTLFPHQSSYTLLSPVRILITEAHRFGFLTLPAPGRGSVTKLAPAHRLMIKHISAMRGEAGGGGGLPKTLMPPTPSTAAGGGSQAWQLA